MVIPSQFRLISPIERKKAVIENNFCQFIPPDPRRNIHRHGTMDDVFDCWAARFGDVHERMALKRHRSAAWRTDDPMAGEWDWDRDPRNRHHHRRPSQTTNGRRPNLNGDHHSHRRDPRRAVGRVDGCAF